MPTSGLLIGWPVAFLLFIAALLVPWWAIRKNHKDHPADSYRRYDPADEKMFWFFGAAFATCVAVLFLFSSWPLTWQYHHWQTKTGQVAEVSYRFVGGGSAATDQKHVVRFTDGEVRGVSDTRMALVSEGDTLSLRCKRAWQWQSTPGWDCRFVSTTDGEPQQ